MWFERHRTVSFILTALIAVEIFWVSSLQFTGKGTANIVSTAYHFIVFFLFSFFLFASVKGNKKTTASQIMLVLILSTAYTVSDEFHQSFVPGRKAGIRDVLTDVSGVFFSMIIYLYISKKYSIPSSRKDEDHLRFSSEEYENEHEE